MSWNKNTLDYSEINSVISTLDDYNIPYEVVELGEVFCNGINDDEDSSNRVLRKLITDKYIFIEQFRRTHDCDGDDVIVSFKYEKGKEEDIPLEIYIDEEDYIYSNYDESEGILKDE